MGQLNPTREEILAAYDALEGLPIFAESLAQSVVQDLCNDILAALPPKPRPTMAEVEWDDEKHYLAEAEHPDQGKVIMLFQTAITENIFIDFHKDGERHLIFSPPEHLTPTGRRYELTELAE